MKAEILQGMDLLDRRSPGWENNVDLDKLDQNQDQWRKDAAGKECGCILVQVFGDYYRGLYELNVREADAGKFGFVRKSWLGLELGFEQSSRSVWHDYKRNYETLTAWWKRLFRARYGTEGRNIG